jgi:hypothetical protein
MSGDPFLERLVWDLKPVRRQSSGVDALILTAICGLELTLFLGIGAARTDMSTAVTLPSFWWKLGSLGAIALMGAAVAITSFDPMTSPRRGLGRLMAVVAVCLVAGWCIDAGNGEDVPLIERLNCYEGVQCVCRMAALSVPAIVGLGILMRRGAPTDPAGTSLAVGIGAAAWGAFVFVFSCPYDDPFYTAVWYAVGCGLVTLIARLLLPRLTHW